MAASKKPAPSVAIIEDNTEHFQRMAGAIKAKFPEAVIHHFADPTDLLEQVSRLCLDIIFTEYRIAGQDGLSVIEALQGQGHGIPVIMVTGKGSEHVAARAIKLGAWDYLVKTPEMFSQLPLAVQQAVWQRPPVPCRKMAKSRFQDLVEQTLDWIWEIDADGRYIYVNPVVRQILGYAPEAVQGRTMLDFFPPESLPKVQQELFPFLERREIISGVQLPMRHQEGHPVMVETNAVPFFHPSGAFAGYRGVHRDITARKTVEQALVASEEKYRLVVENANEAINIAQDGFLRFVNPKSVEMFGRRRQELLERPFVSFIHPEDRDMVMDRHRRRMQGNMPPNRYAFRIINGQALTRWVELNVVPFTWDSRPATLNFLNDITERKLAEDRVQRLSQQLIQAHEIERKRLSLDLHDHLAQDLSSLKMRLDTLCGTGAGLPPEIAQQLAGLSSLARRTIMAVREMAYDLRPASLDQLGLVQTLAQHCEEFSMRNDLTVEFFSAGMEAVSSDFDTDITIYRLVQEALNNIGKHARATRVAVKIVASFPEIIVRIEDNGLGFDVKTRREAALQGRHMGIWSMEQRVAMINGSLKIDSIPHQGTKIVVKIPFKEACGATEKDHFDRG
jgi:PAS domain S-box-containing protein